MIFEFVFDKSSRLRDTVLHCSNYVSLPETSAKRYGPLTSEFGVVDTGDVQNGAPIGYPKETGSAVYI